MTTPKCSPPYVVTTPKWILRKPFVGQCGPKISEISISVFSLFSMLLGGPLIPGIGDKPLKDLPIITENGVSARFGKDVQAMHLAEKTFSEEQSKERLRRAQRKRGTPKDATSDSW